MNILFLFPTMNECSSIATWKKCSTIYQKNDFHYTCCGVGHHSITNVEKYHKFFPIVIGYGGALHPSLETGDVVVSTSFTSTNGTISFAKQDNTAYKLVETLNREGIRSYHKNVYTSSKIISEIDKKDNIRKKYDAWIADMEGYWLADKLENLISIRIVLDTHQMQLPDLSFTLKPNGQISLAKTMFHLIKYPTNFITLNKIFLLTTKTKPIIKKCCNLVRDVQKNNWPNFT